MDGVYIICLTSGSGIPVFTRTAGNVKQLPFPVIGSLNAVHMFAANHNADLKSTSTEDARIVWKEFHNSLVLIAVSPRCSDNDELYLGHLLQLAWSAMVLLYGREELTNIRNVDRFKKEIRSKKSLDNGDRVLSNLLSQNWKKVCFQLLDTLILQESLPVFSDITNAVEGLVCSEAALLQSFLEAFVEAAGSPYGCLLVHQRVVVATRKWWELSSTELVLLNLLTTSCSSCSSRDVPIYLPQLSPTVPHRLMTFELIRNVEVCVICGPTPSLADLEKEIGRFWVPAYETLKSVRQIFPRSLPPSVELDNNILGFLLVNTDTSYSVSSVHLKNDGSDETKLKQRRAILRTFYMKTVGTFLSNSVDGSNKNIERFSHQPLDTYTVYSDFKCYAHSSDSYHLFVLFAPKIPTFAMRSVCQKTLLQIFKDKTTFI